VAKLEIQGLSKRFGATAVLHSISLTAEAGEFISLLGPSGCGKSTLLRIVAGLEQADAGSIRLGGRELAGVAPRDRNVAMVFQSFALYPQMTARENIALPLRARRLTRLQRLADRFRLDGASRCVGAEIDRQVEALAHTLEISALLDRHPVALSGGQRQRVALGRALIRQSSLLLMDEPLSSLDARLRVQTREEIAQIQRQFGVTCLFVTHDQAEAMAVSDRIAVMLHGRIVQLGTPQEIYRAPRSLAVAEFIGSAPLNRFALDLPPDGTVQFGEVPLGMRAPAQAGKSVTLAFRPEGLRLAAAGVPATVRRIEYHGAEAFLRVEHAGRTLIVRTGAAALPAIGAPIHLAPDPAAALLFDVEGKRVAIEPLREPAHV